MTRERDEQVAFSVAGSAIALLVLPILAITQVILCLPWAVLGYFGFNPLDEG